MFTEKLTAAVVRALSLKFPDMPIRPAASAKEFSTDVEAIEYRLLSAQMTRERSDRFVQSYAYEMVWSTTKETRASLPDELFEALETVDVEGTPYRAAELRWEGREDGLPRMMVYYTARTSKSSPPVVVMQHLDSSSALKTAT